MPTGRPSSSSVRTTTFAGIPSVGSPRSPALATSTSTSTSATGRFVGRRPWRFRLPQNGDAERSVRTGFTPAHRQVRRRTARAGGTGSTEHQQQVARARLLAGRECSITG